MADEANPMRKPIGRRDFVKTSMKIAAGGAVVAGTAPILWPLSNPSGLKKRFPYVGARILPPGPAPQGIPLIPVKVREDGLIEGVPENRESNVSHNLDWYKYCGHEKAPGLDVSFTADNVLRYFGLQEKIATARRQGIDLWYQNLLDQEVRAEHFKEVGFGAPFRWRSEGQVQNNIITGIIIKVDPGRVKGKLPDGFMADNGDGTGFIAVCSFCAHFCCVPGWKENNTPLTRTRKGEIGVDGEVIYCSCHDSRYDPLDIREYTFPPDF